MIASAFAAAAVCILILCLTALALATLPSSSKPTHPVGVIGTSDAPVADALAHALEQHMDAGGQLHDVVAYTVEQHPCGVDVLRLVLAGDAVAGAEEILRAGGAG